DSSRRRSGRTSTAGARPTPRPTSSSGNSPPPRCHLAGSGGPTRWRGWSPSWPATGPATSPGRPSMSPVAWASTSEAGGMCRLLGYCTRGRASAASLLTEQGLREFTALSAFHSDGWAMAWYRAGGPGVRTSMRRAADEPDYDQLAHRALGDIGMVHLRWATPGLGLSRQNCHPFRYGRYTLAHNGAIHPQSKLGE